MMYLYLRITVIFMLIFFNGCTSPVEITDIEEIEINGYVWSYLGLEGKSVTAVEDTPWGLFAGTHWDGVFRYDERRNRWISLGLHHAGITDIAFAETDEPKVLVAVRISREEGETTSAVIYASKDEGNSWIEWDGGFAKQHDGYFSARSLLVDDKNPERMYFGSDWAQLLYSEDGGMNWDYIIGDHSTGGGGIYAIALSPERDGRMWFGGTIAFGYPIIGRSDNWGKNSEESFFSRIEGTVGTIIVDEMDAGRLWMRVHTGGIYTSDDGGDNWELVLESFPDTEEEPVLFTGLSKNPDNLYAVGAERTPPPTPYEEWRPKFYKSNSKGTSWFELSLPDDVRGPTGLEVDNNSNLLMTTGDGLWRIERR